MPERFAPRILIDSPILLYDIPAEVYQRRSYPGRTTCQNFTTTTWRCRVRIAFIELRVTVEVHTWNSDIKSKSSFAASSSVASKNRWCTNSSNFIRHKNALSFARIFFLGRVITYFFFLILMLLPTVLTRYDAKHEISNERKQMFL